MYEGYFWFDLEVRPRVSLLFECDSPQTFKSHSNPLSEMSDASTKRNHNTLYKYHDVQFYERIIVFLNVTCDKSIVSFIELSNQRN